MESKTWTAVSEFSARDLKIAHLIDDHGVDDPGRRQPTDVELDALHDDLHDADEPQVVYTVLEFDHDERVATAWAEAFYAQDDAINAIRIALVNDLVEEDRDLKQEMAALGPIPTTLGWVMTRAFGADANAHTSEELPFDAMGWDVVHDVGETFIIDALDTGIVTRSYTITKATVQR